MYILPYGYNEYVLTYSPSDDRFTTQLREAAAAMELIHAAGYGGVWKRLAQAAQRYCSLRVRGEIQIEIVFVDGRGSVLGRCVEGEK